MCEDITARSLGRGKLPFLVQVFIAGYPCIRKGERDVSSDKTAPVDLYRQIWESVSIGSSPEGHGEARRHLRYIDSTISRMAANAATEEEVGLRPAAATASPARTLSSLRTHPDLSVRTAGQTTRLKLALFEVRNCSLPVHLEQHTWEMMRLLTNQIANCSQLSTAQVDFGNLLSC